MGTPRQRRRGGLSGGGRDSGLVRSAQIEVAAGACLWGLRDHLGALFIDGDREPGRRLAIPGTDEASLAERLQTVHGVLHLAWVDQGEGRYWIVCPALMRQIERAWSARIH